MLPFRNLDPNWTPIALTCIDVIWGGWGARHIPGQELIMMCPRSEPNQLHMPARSR